MSSSKDLGNPRALLNSNHNFLQFRLDYFLKRVTSQDFINKFYEKSVKEFQKKKSEKLSQIKQNTEAEAMKEASFKPVLNDKANQKIKNPLINRMEEFLAKKKSALEDLKKQLQEKKESQEKSELTLKPKFFASKNNEKFIEKLKEKQVLEGKKVRHNLLYENKGLAIKPNSEAPRLKNKLSKTTETLSVTFSF